MSAVDGVGRELAHVLARVSRRLHNAEIFDGGTDVKLRTELAVGLGRTSFWNRGLSYT